MIDNNKPLIAIQEPTFKLDIFSWDQETKELFKIHSDHILNNQKEEHPEPIPCDIPTRCESEPKKNPDDQMSDTSKMVDTPTIEQKTEQTKTLSYGTMTLLEQAKKEYNIPIYREIVEHIKAKNYTQNTKSEIADAINDFYTNILRIKRKRSTYESYAYQYHKYLINTGYIHPKTEKDAAQNQDDADQELETMDASDFSKQDKIIQDTEFEGWITAHKITEFTLQQFEDTYTRDLTDDQAKKILAYQIMMKTIYQLSNNTFKVKQL